MTPWEPRAFYVVALGGQGTPFYRGGNRGQGCSETCSRPHWSHTSFLLLLFFIVKLFNKEVEG